eukprot:2727180-Prymnesium_polylepis.1
MAATYSACAHAMLSPLVAGHRGRASRTAGGSAQMCSPMASVSQIRSARSKPLIMVVHIWYLVTKTAAFHGRIGTYNIWHNICVCAELVGEIGCTFFWLGSTTMPRLHPPPQHVRVSMH